MKNHYDLIIKANKDHQPTISEITKAVADLVRSKVAENPTPQGKFDVEVGSVLKR